MDDTKDREKYKVYGELIHTYGYGLEPHARTLEALNYYTNEMVRIPLDPSKSALENAKRYFEKYNKQKRTYEALSKLTQDTKEDIEYLQSVSTALDIALNEDDLAQIKEELIHSGYMRRKFTKKKEKIKSRPFHYLSSDGFHIYVGKNNLQNDWLTFEFAVGNDWWFHAKNTPGSHVVVRTNGERLQTAPLKKPANWPLITPKPEEAKKWRSIILKKNMSKNQMAPNQDLSYITPTIL